MAASAWTPIDETSAAAPASAWTPVDESANLATQAHAEMSAHPGGAAQWFRDLESDLRYGGEQTAVGRGLKAIGYQGAESLGGMEGTAGKTLVSPLTGPAHAAAGVADIVGGKPWQGTKEVASGALDAAQIPSMFIAPEGAEAISAVPGKVGSLIPSAERAGQGFKDVMSAAKDVPIDLQNSQDAILRLVDWQKKTQLGATVNKFLNRVTAPNKGPLTYGEARDFYTLLGKLSADETMKMAPAVRRDLVQMVSGLKTDVGNAAESVGKGAQYYSSMNEFKNAMKLRGYKDDAISAAWEALKKGLPAGAATAGGIYLGKKLLDE